MRRLAVALLVLALAPTAADAKKPYYRPRDVIDSEQLASASTAKLAAAIRGRNAAAVAAVLGPAFTNNGLWFPDAACEKKFAVGGDIKGADVAAFARCLTKLDVQLSTRKAAHGDGAVLTVDPGFEIELAFKGDQLRWIGFPLQSGFYRAVPMLTAQSLESIRTAGTTILDDKVGAELGLELTKLRSTALTTWVKVCLDEAGEVTTTSALNASSATTSEAFLKAIADWKFRPFRVRGKAAPVCGAAQLTYPASRAPAIEVYPQTLAPMAPVTRTYDFDDDELEFFGGSVMGAPPPPPPPPPPSPQNVPPKLLENLRIAGSPAILPDPPTRKAMVIASKTKLSATYRLCVDVRGNVTSILQLGSSGFPDYDAKIQAAMRRWAYRPYKIGGTPTAVCTAVTVSYDASRRGP